MKSDLNFTSSMCWIYRHWKEVHARYWSNQLYMKDVSALNVDSVLKTLAKRIDANGELKVGRFPATYPKKSFTMQMRMQLT